MRAWMAIEVNSVDRSSVRPSLPTWHAYENTPSERHVQRTLSHAHTLTETHSQVKYYTELPHLKPEYMYIHIYIVSDYTVRKDTHLLALMKKLHLALRLQANRHLSLVPY